MRVRFDGYFYSTGVARRGTDDLAMKTSSEMFSVSTVVLQTAHRVTFLMTLDVLGVMSKLTPGGIGDELTNG